MTALIGGLALFALGGPALAAAGSKQDDIAIGTERFYPESIDVDAKGTLYVGSAGRGGIWKIRRGSSQVEQFVAPASGRTRAIFGVRVDERHRTLWACSNELRERTPELPVAKVGIAIAKFDLRTGRAIATIPLPAETFCNDIAVARDGTAYISETSGTRIFRVTPGSKTATVWLPPSALAKFGKVDVDGIAIGADGKLYFNSFRQGGLYRVSLSGSGPRKVERLKSSRTAERADGLRLARNGSLYMVEGSGVLSRLDIRGTNVRLVQVGGKFDGPTGLAPTSSGIWVTEGRISGLFTKSAERPAAPFMLRFVPFERHIKAGH